MFVDVGQGSRLRLERIRRQFLHTNDAVFRPNDAANVGCRDPSSTKKMERGESAWSTYKTLLGWIVDTLHSTIELPEKKKQRLLQILDKARNQKRISVNSCQKLLGELRSMLLAVSGGAGFFSQLQLALAKTKSRRVRLTKGAKDHLQDLYTLALDISNRPTRIAELFPAEPGHFLGMCDASGEGVGGVYMSDNGDAYAWRCEWPDYIRDALITEWNPSGIVTNSDLKLAGTLLQESVIATTHDIREKTIRTGCDNTPAVAWRNKGSTST